MTLRTRDDRAAVLAALDAATMRGDREDMAHLRDILRVPGAPALFWTECGRRAGLATALRSWRAYAWRLRDRERRRDHAR